MAAKLRPVGTIVVDGQSLQGRFSTYDESSVKPYANQTLCDWDNPQAYGGWEFYHRRIASLPKWLSDVLCSCIKNPAALPSQLPYSYKPMQISSKESVYVATCSICGLLRHLGNLHNWMQPDGCETCERPFVNFPYDRYGECQSCRT